MCPQYSALVIRYRCRLLLTTDSPRVPKQISPLRAHGGGPSSRPSPHSLPEGAGAGEDAAFRLGQRVHAAGNPRRAGTVRYVGAVAGHAGAWVGVDWDDGEGKHDGSLAGARYFAARASAPPPSSAPRPSAPGSPSSTLSSCATAETTPKRKRVRTLEHDRI
uniref:CAP-Gly domain-containing protein n=1 Tax=Ananas comosus var. bracteatus TaxID=296719 RepID=A0A6V7QGM3_ANACO|nr:unnamed protein product [Ananas comosus var. bracteatus]